MMGERHGSGRAARPFAAILAALLAAACGTPIEPAQDASLPTDTGVVVDGGAADGGAADGGACLDACPGEGVLECREGVVRSCGRVAGCLVWSAPTSCGGDGCADGERCASCPDAPCSAGAEECTADGLRTCEVDATGCVDWTAPSLCAGGRCADAVSCCPAACELATSSCADGEVRFCQPDASGCAVWTDPSSCASGSCADASRCTADVTIMDVDFGDGAGYSTGDRPVWVGVGDFDGDGHLDVVTVNTDDNSVSLLRGDGLGAFGPALTVSLGFTSRNGDLVRAAVGDVEGDGRADLAVSWRHEDQITVLRGAAFGVPVRVPATEPEGLALADLDGDGRADLVFAASRFGNDDLGVARGRGDGTFEAPVYRPDSAGVQGVIASDHDGDGDIDLHLLGSPFVALRNAGDGTFTEHWRAPTGAGHHTFVHADFDGDGVRDLLTTFSGTNVKGLRRGGAGGTFDEATTLLIGSGRGVATADFDVDGDVDLVHDSCCNSVGVGLNYGDATFAGHSFRVSCGGPEAFAAGDFDEDGLPDIVTAGQLCDRAEVLLNTSR